MKHSEQIRVELAQAKISIAGMRNAESLGQFEEQWNDLLQGLERIWNKASNHYGKSPKWKGWKGKYEDIRKNDPLLTYLAYARRSDEHAVIEIPSDESRDIGLDRAEGNDLYIDHMMIDNEQIYIESPQKIRLNFIPANTRLVPVVARGQRHGVPVYHRGNPIDPTEVVKIAETAMGFYQDFLNDAESYFVK
jgi:hypothetical protein